MGARIKTDVTFVRCVNNGWFSLGFWAGRLDIDGELLKIANIRQSYGNKIK